jgi:hypothetical protein
VVAMTPTDLKQFTGTEHYYQWSPLFRSFRLTDGTKYLAEEAGAYWLMDAIASHWPTVRKHEACRQMCFWTLQVHGDKSADLYCHPDEGEPAVVHQHIEFTDFPFNVHIWQASTDDGADMNGYVNILYLPSEH